MALKTETKLKAKLTCAFKNDIRNFATPEHLKVPNLGL